MICIHLNLYQFESGTATTGTPTVVGNVTGTVNFGSGTLQTVTINGSMTPGSIFNASNINTMTIGPAAKTLNYNLAGQLNVLGKLGSLRVAGGTPGSISAGSIGTIGVQGGYGQVVSQIREAGIQRRVDADLPNNPYPNPDQTALPSPSGSSYVNFQYFYEGNGTGLYNPQFTTHIVNGTGSTLPDQYDLNLMTYNDVAKFNLARVDAAGVSGVRNVVAEGDLLTVITAAAQTYFGLASTAGGVVLPQDNVAGVEIRDFVPLASISAKSIQAIAFGSMKRANGNTPITGSLVVATDARALLTSSTPMVMAGSVASSKNETFRVPFADLPTQQVTFFMDTTLTAAAFDNNDIIFVNQANGGQKMNGPRSSDVALMNVAVSSFPNSPTVTNAIIQTLDIRGDGGSFISNQWSAKAITSTGPLGDTAVNHVLGITNLTTPNVFGNMSSYGPILGTVQTTGIRIDPVTGIASTTSSDFGRSYLTNISGVMTPTATTVTTDQNGRPPAGLPAGISGTVIARGNLISKVQANGGITGNIAVQGDIGASLPLTILGPNGVMINSGAATRIGGIITDYSPTTGHIVGLGRFIGDLSLLGGLLTTGSVTVRGSILGNVNIASFGAGTSLLSGGTIGDPTLGTGIIFNTNQGMVAAKGVIVNKNNTMTSPGYWDSNASAAPDQTDVRVIDSIYSDPTSLPIAGLDYIVLGDLGGLGFILTKVGRLHVVSNRLSVT